VRDYLVDLDHDAHAQGVTCGNEAVFGVWKNMWQTPPTKAQQEGAFGQIEMLSYRIFSYQRRACGLEQHLMKEFHMLPALNL
jgi:hypothetical protein